MPVEILLRPLMPASGFDVDENPASIIFIRHQPDRGERIMATPKKKLSQPVRIGVIGAGGMGQGHCRTIQKIPEARLTAVCDVHAPSAEKAGQTFSVAAFTDHRDLIKAGGCDAVLIATPHPLHAATAIDCLNAGLPVLTEKPMSERSSMADQMVRTAKRNRVALAVMFQLRFAPPIVKAREIIRSGQLGAIHRTFMIDPQYRTQLYYDSGTWRATWQGEGGGVLMNQSPHLIDLFIYLGGMPSEVYGRTETRLHHIEVEDQAVALLKYPGGGTGYLFCSTMEPGPGQVIELCGDRGRLTLRNNVLAFSRFEPGIRDHIAHATEMWGSPQTIEMPVGLPQPQIMYNDYEAPVELVPAHGGHHADVIGNFVRHILSGEPLVTPGTDCLGSLELANAITLSSHENRWIKLPLNRKRYDALLNKLRRESRFVKKVRQTLRITDPRIG